MKLDALAERLGAHVIAGPGAGEIEIDRFYADDKISGLLTQACCRTLVVSRIIDPHIFRVAKLVDVPAICLLDSNLPENGMVNAAEEQGTALMVSPVGFIETLKRLYQCLGLEARLIHEDRTLHDTRR